MKPRTRTKSSRKKPKEIGLRRKIYDSENLNNALQAVKEGMSKKLAAKTYQVPRATLQYRIKNPEHQSRPGPPTILTEKEEKDLVDWISLSCRKGFPKRKDDVISSVAYFLETSNRASVFKKGEKWYKLFLQRHPNISIRTPEAVTTASAAVSENDVRGWFTQIEVYLKENNLFKILSNPARVFNGDETNFLLCPKTGVVLAPKGERNVYEIDNAPAKTSLTVMFTFSANGDLTPPMVIFPNKRLSEDIRSKVPSGWGIGLSDNGWMKAEVFHDYIENVLHPHLIKKETQFPVILFVDGHKTHLTYAVSELCKKLGIVLIALYPNCTRLLQPADVSAFKPLKSGWQKTVLEWRRNNPSVALTKIDFVPLLNKTIKNTISSSTVINGFRATGLCPWNVNAVDYTKCLGKANIPHAEAINKVNKERKAMTKEQFKNIIGAKKISEIELGTLGPEDNYIKKIWDFFTELQTDLNVDDTFSQKDADMRFDAMDIENLPVVLSEDLRQESSSVPASASEVIISAEDFDNSNDDRLSHNSQVLHITHKAEVYNPKTEKTIISVLPHKIERPMNIVAQLQDLRQECSSVPAPASEVVITAEDFDNCNDDRLSHNSQVLHMTHKAEVYNPTPTNKLNPNNLPQQIERPMNIVAQLQTSEFDKIETYVDPVPIKVQKRNTAMLNLTPIKLTDVLVLPKSPQRKGVRDIKRAPFVLTSDEWRSIESEKLRVKLEKEEGIKRRKEEREKKKLEAKTKKTKPNVPAAKLKIKKEHERVNTDVKKLVLLEKLNNVNIPLNPPQTEKVDCIPDEKQEDQENYTDYAYLTREDKDRKQNKILYTAAEIEKFLTEFED